MPSSTFSSEAPPAAAGERHYGRAIGLALAAAALLWAGLEATTYAGLKGISKIEHRKVSEHAAARGMRPAQGNTPTVLLMGNSLLLEGVAYPEIRALAAPHVQVTRFVLENTSYYEWYFGIRKLLAEGSRPGVLMLCLSPSQLIGSSMGSDYAKHYFFLPGDLYAASRAAGYDLTQASSLAFSQFSFYYARRNTLRTLLLREIAPAYWDMAHSLTSPKPKFPPSGEVERIAEQRLRALGDEAAKVGSRFVFLIPPGFGDGEREVVAAGAKAGAEVMAPIHLGALAPAYFSDGFHLNAEGARVFTKALSEQLATLGDKGQTGRGPGRGIHN
jgi:hypothetical protein